MIRLPERWRRRATTPGPRVTPGSRVYCIGDIHGRLDLLLQLQQQILADAARFEGRRSLVYLGDYIDRGGQSRQVIDHLLDRPLDGFQTVYLKGNHEQALLDFLSHPEATAAWLQFGGRETLASYGIDTPRSLREIDLKALANVLARTLPDRHREFLAATVMHHRDGDYFFVHAGIRPGVALDAQHRDDLLWIRDEFTEDTRDHGAVIVHGHTITPDPEWRPNRIGLDTGAFHTDVLTCLVLEEARFRFLQTRRMER